MKNTIIDLFENAVRNYGDAPFMYEKLHSTFEPTSFNQLRDIVYDFGAGLCDLGVQPKDNIALLSEGRNLWICSELALLYAGAVSVPLSIKLEESNDLLFRMRHAECKYLIVSGQQLRKIRTIREQLTDLKYLILLDRVEDMRPDELYYEDVMERGRAYLKEHREEFLAIGQAVQNEDLATITYTSGTTADPKGVCLTHRNYTANVDQSLGLIPITKGYKMLIILPLDHCFAHVVGFYSMMKNGGRIATVPAGKTPMEALRNIPMAIKEFKPNVMMSVPAIAKNFKKNIEQTVHASGKFAEFLYNVGLNAAIRYNKEGWNRGTNGTFFLKPLIWAVDRLVFKKVRQGLGGELDFFVGGGALLDIDLQRYYCAIGLPMLQGYGLSEATPVISANTQKRYRLGSSGLLVQPMDLRILDEEGNECPTGKSGEIVIRGENVMAGYWKNPKSSAETVKDGWLHTGDMGYMHESGFLYVLGRFKSLLIASDGEKYAPEGIEECITEKLPYVNNTMMYNNQSPYTICVLDVDKNKLPQGAEGARKIREDLDKFRSGREFGGMFPDRWLPATFVIADEPFSEKNRMINSTMKMVRSKVEEAYKERIEYAFTPEGKDPANPLNCKALS